MFASSRLCTKFHPTKLLLLGSTICITAAMVMLLLVWFGVMTVAAIILPMMFYTLGAGMIYPSGFSGCVSCFPEKSGAISSLTFAAQNSIIGLIATFATRLHITDQWSLASALLTLALLSLLTIYFINKVAKEL
jgi:hypothetical protein